MLRWSFEKQYKKAKKREKEREKESKKGKKTLLNSPHFTAAAWSHLHK